MTKFADQLFDDLMREHGPALARTGAPAPPKPRRASRPVLVTAGAAGLAAMATAGALLSDGGTPAFAATPHADGTVTLAVHDKSGYAGINTELRKLGDGEVVVVPVEAGCPTSISALPAPTVQPENRFSVQRTLLGWVGRDGSVTVKASGIPAGDILVVAIEIPASGGAITTLFAAKLTSAPAPSCVVSPFLPPSSGTGKI